MVTWFFVEKIQREQNQLNICICFYLCQAEEKPGGEPVRERERKQSLASPLWNFVLLMLTTVLKAGKQLTETDAKVDEYNDLFSSLRHTHTHTN